MIRKVKKVMQFISRQFGYNHVVSPSLKNGAYGSDWYDRAYRSVAEYHVRYPRSRYYFLWTVIVDRLRRDSIRSVLEIGCGPGQLAAFLMDQGLEKYVGLDFSEAAIDLAKANSSRGRFLVGDARSSEIYVDVEHDAIICTEVLEHIEDDLIVVSRFRPGKRCLCSVPSFPYESHVRHFDTAQAVEDRYGVFFNKLDVMTLPSPISDDDSYFLLDGIRNDFTIVTH